MSKMVGLHTEFMFSYAAKRVIFPLIFNQAKLFIENLKMQYSIEFR